MTLNKNVSPEINEEAEESKNEAKAILDDYLEDPRGRSPFDVLDEISSEYDGDFEDLIGY